MQCYKWGLPAARWQPWAPCDGSPQICWGRCATCSSRRSEWLNEAWSSDHGVVHRWLKDECFVPLVTFSTCPDGTTTVSVREMDSVLKDV